MRIISYNVNGIRAAIKKGLLAWMATDPADIICLQEPKATENDIDVQAITDLGYEVYWFAAQKKGYSGVTIFTKIKPNYVELGNKIEQSDFEGRVIRADFGPITLVNAYFPSGTSGDLRQDYKYIWLNEFEVYVKDLIDKGRQMIIVGDYNIAHNAIDIHDPKGNKKSSGFLPEERAWMDNWLGMGLIDTYRHKNPDTVGGYSWWSQRFPTVRLNNKGWRIDYICVSTSLAEHIKVATIYPDVKHSDHCPIYMELDV